MFWILFVAFHFIFLSLRIFQGQIFHGRMTRFVILIESKFFRSFLLFAWVIFLINLNIAALTLCRARMKNFSPTFRFLFSTFLSSRNLINIKAASLGGKSWICRQLGGVFCHFKFLIDSISLPKRRHYFECLLENKNKTNWTQQSYTTFNFFQRLNMTAKHMHNWLQKP